MLVISLGHSGREVEQRRTRGDADHHRKAGSLTETQRLKARRPLIGHREALDGARGIEVVYDRGIATAGANHGMTYAVGDEQGG